ncbi:AAA family ATPase [Anaerococcus sp. Marseille-P3625]|uniref:AAA family ATPase n=1 Tax=Anaerococcus sp. Marseille-P3625 TaxID=1977277 RepID=UPI000C0754E5|nr:AAA family ATPase [Anaerococcus sp. Marseille-P3625]
MKPIRLKFRGFLTYKNQIEIDFTKLYDKKVFVISGDTGSGKTSIFDAIQYGLYGEVSRGIDVYSLRSDYLNENDPYTFVNLTFKVDEKIYEIERIPSQFAKKTKENQNIKNSAIFYEITNEKKIIAEKIGEVNEKIKQIIGLDKNQFSKVMLLAQGEFQEFLKAKSDDRSKILGDIFKTYEYKEIQERIKNEALEANKNIDIIDRRLEDVIYKYDNLSKNINREDVLVHDFANIKKTVKSYQEKNQVEYEILEKNEKDLSKKEKLLIEDREKAKIQNENIAKYKQIAKDLAENLSKNEKYKKLDQDLKKASYGENIKIYYQSFNKAKADLEKEENDLGKLKELFVENSIRLEAIKKDQIIFLKKEEELNLLKISLNDNKKLLDDFNEFQIIKEKFLSMEEDEKEIKKIDGNIIQLNNNLKENNDKFIDKSKEINQLKADKLAIQESIYQEKNKEESIKNKLDIIKENEKILEKISENKKLIEIKKEEKIKLEEKQKLYFENQRLIQINKFIDELNESGICPVCKEKHQENFSKYQTFEIDIDKVNRNIVQVSSDIETLNSKNNLFKNSLKEVLEKSELLKELEILGKKLAEKENSLKENQFLIENIEEELKKYKVNVAEISAKLDEFQKNKSYLEEKNQDFEKTKISYMANKEKMEEIDSKLLAEKIAEKQKLIAKISKEIEENKKLYDEIKLKDQELKINMKNTKELIEKTKADKISYKEDFEKRMLEKFENIEEFEKYLDLFDEINAYKDEITSFFKDQERLITLSENYIQYKDLDIIDTKKIDENLSEVNESLSDIREKKLKININLSNIYQTISDLDEISKLYDDKKKDAEILAKLSKVANGSFGKVSGREKIDFESFVLTYYFDKVLSYANKRLDSMSNGQFMMVRSSTGNDLRQKQGLDIEIFDYNTGKKRPSSTLSGGESFLASLALALGLSDEISAENGSIKIDTLFIDEGFGTLSEDYLSNVIEQIEKLSYENKFIGLISHVKELKDAIDGKILVTYTSNQGSFIEVKA